LDSVWEGIGLQQAWESDAFEGKALHGQGALYPLKRATISTANAMPRDNLPMLLLPKPCIGLPSYTRNLRRRFPNSIPHSQVYFLEEGD